MNNSIAQTPQVQTLTTDVYSARADFEKCLNKETDINFDKEAQFAVQILAQNSYAMNIATGSPLGRQSVISSVKNIASIGISLNPARKQAYLVPRDKRICLDISYQGLIDIAVQSGSIKWAQARIVHENDFFELNGVDKEPTHRFDPFGKQRGEYVGVYVTVKTSDGDYLTETMSVEDINAIRDKSESFKRSGKGPWRDFWPEMAKKTVVKRAQKYWPKNDRLSDAIHYLNIDGEEGISKEENNDTSSVDKDVFEKWKDRINAAKTAEEARDIYVQANKECKNLRNADLWARLKEEILLKVSEIKSNVIDGEYTEKGDA